MDTPPIAEIDLAISPVNPSYNGLIEALSPTGRVKYSHCPTIIYVIFYIIYVILYIIIIE